MMAKLIPREGGVIRYDPAAASLKRALQPRAALQPTRGSAAGRAQPGAGVAKTCLSVAGVLRRNLLCRAHLQKKITGSHNPAETNQRGTGDRETKGAAASRRGRAGVNPERYRGGSGAPHRLEQEQHSNTRDKTLGTQPPLRGLRAGPVAAWSWPRTGAFSRAVSGGETSRATLRQREPVSASSISITACRQGPAKEAAKFPRTEAPPLPPGRALPPAAPGHGSPRGRGGAGRGGSRRGRAGTRRPELSVVLRAGGAAAARLGARVPHGRSRPAPRGTLPGAGRARRPPPLPRGLPVPWLTHRPSTTSGFVSTLSAPAARSFPAGAGISRGLRLREPFHLATDGFVYLFTSPSRAESRSWPGRGRRLERDRDCRNSAARHRVWGAVRGDSKLSGGRKGDETRTARLESHGRQRRRTESHARWCAVPGGGEATPRIPARRPALCPAAARRNARPCAGFFFLNKQRSPFPARATRPVSLRGSLCPGSAPSRCKPGAGQTKEGLHFQPRFPNGQRGSERERFLPQTCSRAPSSWVWKYISGGRGFSPPSPRRPCFRHRPRRQRQPPSPAVPPSPRSLSCPPRFPKHQEPPAPAQAGTPGPRAGPAREGRVGGRSSILHELSILILTTFQRVCAGKTEP